MIEALFGGGSEVSQVIVREIRLPRTMLALAIGAILGLSGAALQGLLRNPLASPSLFGAPQSAAFGAVLMIALGLADVRSYALPRRGDHRGVRVGVRAAGDRRPQCRAVDADPGGAGDFEPCGRCDRAGDESLPNPFAVLEIAFWLLGSLEDRSFQHVMLALPFIVAGAVMLSSQRNAFRALSLGEETAQSLGVDVGRLRLFVISGVALGVGGAVAVRHHRLHRAGRAASDAAADRPRSGAAAGAERAGRLALLLAADIAVRIIPSTSDIKVGVLTAMIGVPFFLYLIVRERRALGGGVA